MDREASLGCVTNLSRRLERIETRLSASSLHSRGWSLRPSPAGGGGGRRMATLARRLSFGRRRQSSSAFSSDTSGKLREGSFGDKPRTPPGGSEPSEASPESSEADFPRSHSKDTGPLKGSLHKKHKQRETVAVLKAGWGKRHFEVDDFLGCLYYYRTFADMERRTPSRVYLLRELIKVAPLGADRYGHEHAFELRFTWSSCLQDSGSETLVLAADNHATKLRWIRGLHWRMARHAEAPKSHEIRRLKLGRRDGNDGSSGASSMATAFSTPCVHLGICVCNWGESAIGVEVAETTPGDLAHCAGVLAGDHLIAVDGAVCLSHSHAIKLLHQSPQRTAELFVRQPTNRPPPPTNRHCHNSRPSSDDESSLSKQPSHTSSEFPMRPRRESSDYTTIPTSELQHTDGDLADELALRCRRGDETLGDESKGDECTLRAALLIAPPTSTKGRRENSTWRDAMSDACLEERRAPSGRPSPFAVVDISEADATSHTSMLDTRPDGLPQLRPAEELAAQRARSERRGRWMGDERSGAVSPHLLHNHPIGNTRAVHPHTIGIPAGQQGSPQQTGAQRVRTPTCAWMEPTEAAVSAHKVPESDTRSGSSGSSGSGGSGDGGGVGGGGGGHEGPRRAVPPSVIRVPDEPSDEDVNSPHDTEMERERRRRAADSSGRRTSEVESDDEGEASSSAASPRGVTSVCASALSAASTTAAASPHFSAALRCRLGTESVAAWNETQAPAPPPSPPPASRRSMSSPRAVSRQRRETSSLTPSSLALSSAPRAAMQSQKSLHDKPLPGVSVDDEVLVPRPAGPPSPRPELSPSSTRRSSREIGLSRAEQRRAQAERAEAGRTDDSRTEDRACKVPPPPGERSPGVHETRVPEPSQRRGQGEPHNWLQPDAGFVDEDWDD